MFSAASLLPCEAVVPPETGPALPCAAAFTGWCSGELVAEGWSTPAGAVPERSVSYQSQSKLHVPRCLPAWAALIPEPGAACTAEQGREAWQ